MNEVKVKIGNENVAYEQQCFFCGGTNHICLHAFRRLDRNKISGWYCICDKCSNKIPIIDEFILKSQVKATRV